MVLYLETLAVVGQVHDIFAEFEEIFSTDLSTQNVWTAKKARLINFFRWYQPCSRDCIQPSPWMEDKQRQGELRRWRKGQTICSSITFDSWYSQCNCQQGRKAKTSVLEVVDVCISNRSYKSTSQKLSPTLFGALNSSSSCDYERFYEDSSERNQCTKMVKTAWAQHCICIYPYIIITQQLIAKKFLAPLSFSFEPQGHRTDKGVQKTGSEASMIICK